MVPSCFQDVLYYILHLQCMRIMIDTVKKSLAKCPDFGYFCISEMELCIREIWKTLLIKYYGDDTYKRSAEVANIPLYKSDDTKSVFPSWELCTSSSIIEHIISCLFLNEGPLSCWESFRGLLFLHWSCAALLVFGVSVLRGSLRKRRVRFTGLTVGVHLRVMLCWQGWWWINLCREIWSFNTACPYSCTSILKFVSIQCLGLFLKFDSTHRSCICTEMAKMKFAGTQAWIMKNSYSLRKRKAPIFNLYFFL